MWDDHWLLKACFFQTGAARVLGGLRKMWVKTEHTHLKDTDYTHLQLFYSVNSSSL